MPKIQYVEQRFNTESRKRIEQADAIITEYAAQGFSLTLRQLYYQFVARGFLANSQKNYKRLGSTINNARLAGLIDWHAIEDRTRNLQGVPTWESPQSVIDSAAQSFRIDKWADQDVRPEVWIEKEALVGVIEPVCHEYRVPFFACRGYASQSEAWRAGERFKEYQEAGQRVLILHLGDHDPSGIDMTRDNDDRLQLFAPDAVEMRRIALNWDQVQAHKPPPNPCKITDSRAVGYIRKFGRESWELDALDPTFIGNLLRRQFDAEIDKERWTDANEREAAAREKLAALAKRWKDTP